MKYTKFIFLIIAMSLVFTALVSASETHKAKSENRIAVFDIETSYKFDKKLSDAVSGAMRSEIANISKYEVLDQDKMDKLSGGQKCLIAPYFKECYIEKGRLLNVRKIFTGNVVYFNKLYYLSFQSVDTKTGEVENIAEGECAENEIIKSAKNIASKLTNNIFYFQQPNPKPDWRSSKEVNEFTFSLLEASGRVDWQQPQKVVDHLQVNPGDIIAEIGAGTGFFTSFLSKKAGAQGIVYSVDIEKDMLEYLDNRIKREGLTNVKTVLAVPEGPTPLPKESVNLAFLSEVYFAVSDRQNFLKQLGGKLKKDGRLAIVDFQKPPQIPFVPVTAINFDTLDINSEKPEDAYTIALILSFNHYINATGNAGYPYRYRVPREQVIEEVTKAGFKLSADYDFLPYQYFLVFSKL